MSLRQLKNKPAIRLRDEIAGTLGDESAIESDPDRTPGRDETAQWLVENVVEKDRWSANVTDIAE